MAVGGDALIRLAGATALACLAQFGLAAMPAVAQDASVLARSVPADAQMLLEADNLVYDRDNATIAAVGGVRIDYGGHRLVAERVTYHRASGRLVASGNVEIVERSGAIIRASEIDITDDFRDGFVNALQVETTDQTYFGAESAERRDGNLTTFNNGVYTACKPCEDQRGKPPIWQIKASRIIWNGETRTIRFERARFELFGMPIAGLPYFEIADHTVKRKTGFLIPSLRRSHALGTGVTVPYYIALGPSRDLTLQATGLTRQGFLGEAEWREQFDHGQFSLKIAGIHQNQPDAFPIDSVDRHVTNRAMVGSKGEFQLNPRWTFGWDLLWQTDKNFAHRYGIEGYDSYVHRSEIYLTGLNDRNYFDLRFMRFNVQESAPDWYDEAVQRKQPWVLPTLDYSRIHGDPVWGGELSFDVNFRGIYRDEEHYLPGRHAIPGVGGKSARLTAEAEWKRSFITDQGLVITPSLHVRGDAIHFDPSFAGEANIADAALWSGVMADIRSEYFRTMATAGLELRYPVLISAGASTHVIEPIAQLFVRPDEPFAERFGIPNEDAQSFVFDAATLFERDKYSGYDRMEGGTRANLGLRYSASLANGWTADALVGQSFHLAGVNSFATPDLVHAGLGSGLDTDQSDYVGMFGVSTDSGISASISGRLDHETLEVRRTELRSAYSGETIDATLRYTFIEAQPLYGMPDDRRELQLATAFQLTDSWRVFGSGTYDFVSGKLVNSGFGFGYEDDCFTYLLAYSESRSILGTEPTERNIGFRISLRTLGDLGSHDSGTRF